MLEPQMKRDQRHRLPRWAAARDRAARRAARCAVAMAVVLLAVSASAVCSRANPALAPGALKGAAPDYGRSRDISAFHNDAAVLRGIWVPGLDAGYVPQGLSFADGTLLVAAYGGPEGGHGTCRVYRVHPLTGAVAGYFDLPGQVRHAGGLAYDRAGTLYVADTHVLVAVALAASLASAEHVAVVKASAPLGDPLRGSFIAFDGTALWLGRWDKSSAQELSRVDPARVVDGRTLGAADVSGRLPIAKLSQGAAFDAQGRLWLSQSNSRLGRLQVLHPAGGAVLHAYDFATGVEDLTFAPDGTLYALSEAGARPYLSWSEFHPLIFAVDAAKLK
jgi:sugar lactone lactonase YvrE